MRCVTRRGCGPGLALLILDASRDESRTRTTGSRKRDHSHPTTRGTPGRTGASHDGGEQGVPRHFLINGIPFRLSDIRFRASNERLPPTLMPRSWPALALLA